jgi:hypothetical protein
MKRFIERRLNRTSNPLDLGSGIRIRPYEWAPRGILVFLNVPQSGYGVHVYPDDSGKDLSTVLSYLAGRSLSREEVWTAMELPRSTYYDQLDKGTLITADNLRTAAGNLGINRAELLTRYRFIDPEEVTALAEEIRGRAYHPTSAHPTSAHPTSALTDVAVSTANRRATITELRPRSDAPPL